MQVRGPSRGLGSALPKEFGSRSSAGDGVDTVGKPTSTWLAPVAPRGAVAAPAPISVLDQLPKRCVRVGEARWFTTRPPASEAPLALYARVEGRAPNYYEIADVAKHPEAVCRLLEQCDDLLALQLPSNGLTPAMLQVLQNKTSRLECLQLSGSCQPGPSVAALVRHVAPHLQALSLGRPFAFYPAQSADNAGEVLAWLTDMPALRCLDVGCMPAGVSTGALMKALDGKHLEGLTVAGDGWDWGKLLRHPALETLRCLDMSAAQPHRKFVHWHRWEHLPERLAALTQLRWVQLPATMPCSAAQLPAVCPHAMFVSLGEQTCLSEARALPELHCSETAPGDCHRHLRTLADLDPLHADVGRWIPAPYARWADLALRKKGAVYLLTELQALAAQGVHPSLTHVEMAAYYNAYHEVCYRFAIAAGNARYSLEMREDDLDEALAALLLSRAIAAQGAKYSLTITQPEFDRLTEAWRRGEVALHQALRPYAAA